MDTALSLATTPSALGPQWLNAEYLLTNVGGAALIVITLIIFAECGILLGFFLPGDSLLFTGGLFIAKGLSHEPLWLFCLVISLAAILGNVVGYFLGQWIGHKWLNNTESKLHKHVLRTHDFMEKNGPRAILLARFVPIVRTFITVIAGATGMNKKIYMTYSAIGGIVWASGVTILGYFLGNISFINKNLEAVLLGVVAISLIPVVLEFLKARKEGKAKAAQETESTAILPRIEG
jgi:membrane-associated protein